MMIIITSLHSLPLYFPTSTNAIIPPCPSLFSSSQTSLLLSLSTFSPFTYNMKHHHHHHQQLALPRSASTRRITPSNHNTTALKRISSSSSSSSSFSKIPETDEISEKLLITRNRHSTPTTAFNRLGKLHSLLRSLLHVVTLPNFVIPTCKWLSLPSNLSTTPSLGRKLIGTLFGNRRGHVSFSVQEDPRSEPVLLLELATSTATLVKEMSSGLVRIALECEKVHNPAQSWRCGKLFHEPMWSMYCNGRRCGYAVTRSCSDSDWHLLRTIQSVSVGAGLIPVVEDGRKSCGEGELLYMRARFERVVGSRDSEAFYMLNPDGSGGPELSIFLLRI